MNHEILDLIVRLVIAIVSVIITSCVIPWVKSKIDSTKYNDFLSLVAKCVEAAEKIYTPEEWNKKKAYVFSIAENYAQEHGVNISIEEINAIIEGWVKEIKG